MSGKGIKREFFKILKFAGVGVINVLLDLCVYTFCFEVLKLPTYQSQLLGVSCGLICGYLLNRKYTFHADGPFFSPQLFKFALVSLFCAPLSSAGIHYLDDTVQLGPWWSKLIVTACVGMLNYALSRSFVFHSVMERKIVRRAADKIYAFNKKIYENRYAQVLMVSCIGIAVDLLMYFYLIYVDLDAYKAQPLCVACGMVCTYLAILKFIPYKIEHAVGYFFVGVFCTVSCSPVMYIFDINFGLHALLAKIPATLFLALVVFALCRLIVFRDVFENE